MKWRKDEQNSVGGTSSGNRVEEISNYGLPSAVEKMQERNDFKYLLQTGKFVQRRVEDESKKLNSPT